MSSRGLSIMTLEVISTKSFLKSLGGERGYRQTAGTFGKILAFLELHRGKMVLYPQIVEYLWGDREDGGPEDPENNIGVYVLRLRRSGYLIRTHYGRGLTLCS